MKAETVGLLKIGIYVIGIVVLLVSIFVLPQMASHLAETNPEYAHLQYPVLFGIYLTAIPFFLALYKSLNLLKLISRDQAFSLEAVNTLNFIKYCAMIIIVLYVFGMIYLYIQNALHPSVAIVALVILFTSFMITLFSALLRELLYHALSIKRENELTV